MKYKFKENFHWGAATSALQCEGHHVEDGKAKTTWDIWFEEEPQRFYDSIDNSIAVDFYTMYETDIKLAKELGLKSIRFSIAWSRVILEDGSVNKKSLKHYSNVIDCCIKNEIEPFVCLFHFDMPWEMQKLGGWESRTVLEEFVRYAKICFEEYGDRVTKWFTHNEPYVPVEACYYHGFHYPFINDFSRGQQATFFTALSHAMVVNLYKEMRKLGHVLKNGQIGAILSINLAMPKDELSSKDVDAAKKMNILYNDSLLSMMGCGVISTDYREFLNDYEVFPTDWNQSDEEMLALGISEILGINYYFPRRVEAKNSYDNPITAPESFAQAYVLPTRKYNKDRGWEIYPKGLYDTLKYVQTYVPNTWLFVSENGIGRQVGEAKDTDLVTGFVSDDERIEFVKEHLEYVHKAIEEGVNVNGYHMWALMDNWSMSNAFKNKYGFIKVDHDNNLKRSIKKSGYWIKSVSKNNGF